VRRARARCGGLPGAQLPSASGERRQQLKCLGAGAGTLIACFALNAATGGGSGLIGDVSFSVGFTALPVAMGVGILRYRLYEIDRLVSRTLTYAILTALLVGTFVGLIALTTDVLAISSRVGVAASTLAAAALFNPLRNASNTSSTAASTRPLRRRSNRRRIHRTTARRRRDRRDPRRPARRPSTAPSSRHTRRSGSDRGHPASADGVIEPSSNRRGGDRNGPPAAPGVTDHRCRARRAVAVIRGPAGRARVPRPRGGSPTGTASVVTGVTWFVFGVTFTAVGVVVARREPRNPMGWLLLGAALSIQVGSDAPSYAYFDYKTHHGALPLGPVAVLLSGAWS